MVGLLRECKRCRGMMRDRLGKYTKICEDCKKPRGPHRKDRSSKEIKTFDDLVDEVAKEMGERQNFKYSKRDKV